ncbi:MAG: ParB/RepB/Spo0J family partition protein [Verrucomicrobiota bacterium]
MNVIEYIDLNKLQPSPTNPRKTFDVEKLKELADSIRQHGIMQNLTVRKVGSDGMFEIVAGERRFRGAVLTEEKQVPCVVRVLTDNEVVELQLVENLQREDVLPSEEARGYASLLKLKGEDGVALYSPAEIASKIGCKAGHIRSRLKLINAPAKILKMIDRGEVPIRVGEMVGRIPDKAERKRAMDLILSGGDWGDGPMSITEAAELIREDFIIDLRLGGFSLSDQILLPKVGACKDCEFRTGNDPDLGELLADRSGGRGKVKRGIDPDLCTRPVCFREKSELAWKEAASKAKLKGQKVLSLTEAELVFQNNQYPMFGGDYADLSRRPGYEDLGHYDESAGTWGKLLRGAPDVPVVLARNPYSGRTHKLVVRKLAVEAVNEKAAADGVESIFSKRPVKNEKGEGERKAKAKAKREEMEKGEKVTVEALNAMAELINKKGVDSKAKLVVLRMVLDEIDYPGKEFIARKWLGMDGKLGDGGWGGVVMEHVVASDPDGKTLDAWITALLLATRMKWEGIGDKAFGDLAVIYGLNVAKIEREIMEA